MMYSIYSRDGQEMGQYEGADKAEALAAMHREAGYDVVARHGELYFRSKKLIFDGTTDKEVCGDLSDWDIQEV